MHFEGDSSGTRAFLKTISGKYYVYTLSRPDGRPFYVGKGLNWRALEHEAEARRNHPTGETNPFKCNVIRKVLREGGSITYCIDSVFDLDHEQKCLEREAFLIAQHRRLHEGGCLTNLAGGLANFLGAATYSLEKHSATLAGEPADNPERAILNRFLLSIGPVSSVPIKPVSQISRILLTTPHPSPRQPSMRCAYALIASASASGLQLVDGIRIPRMFHYQGVDAIIENGVSRDILKAGMANVSRANTPTQEMFELGKHQVEILSDLVGIEMLNQRGLL